MINPERRAAIGDALADALSLPIEERAAAILALHPLPPEPAIKLPVGPITNLRVETDRQMAERLRRGG